MSKRQTAEIQRLETYAKLVRERDRYRIALATISDADCPEAPISRETCARVASDALNVSSSLDAKRKLKEA